MSIAKRIAGDAVAMCLVWLAWAVLAPITMGYPTLPTAKHVCPSPAVSHGVGGNLKTYRIPVDRCRSFH